MKILVTGFEPYANVKVNCTRVVIERLRGLFEQLHVRVLDTKFNNACEITEALVELRPDVAVSLGMSPASTTVQLERYAVNMMDTLYPDNAGNRPMECPISGDAAVAYQVPDLTKLCTVLRNLGIPAQISNSAGTYVCNATMFHALDTIARRGLDCRYVFIHLPALPDEVAARKREGRNGASMSAAWLGDAVYYSIMWAGGRLIPELATIAGDGELTARPWRDEDLAQLCGYHHHISSGCRDFFLAPEQIPLWRVRVRDCREGFCYALCLPDERIIGEARIEMSSALPQFRVRIFPPYNEADYEERALDILRGILESGKTK